MTALLEITGLEVHFPIGGGLFRRPRGMVRAIDGVDLTVREGEILALVGESGCGKTTLGRAILGLVEPTAGSIRFAGTEIVGQTADARRSYHRHVQMVFQDPYDSLNPRKTVLQTLAQPLERHRVVTSGTRADAVVSLLDRVGLSPGRNFLDRYPHQFSGGQRQRIGIARALAVEPRLIVADEAVSALDISIRAQILDLLRRLQREDGLAYLFITHDLGVVRSFADRVAVMYLGEVVEEAPTDSLFALPRHPYSRALLDASPVADPARARARRTAPLTGDVPSPANPPSGCRFHTRCPVAQPICSKQAPARQSFANGQWSACHFAEEAATWQTARPLETTPA